MNATSITGAVLLTTLLSVGVAAADENTQPKDESSGAGAYPHKLAPVNHALELTIGTGYAQGVGNVGTGLPSLTDLGSAGGAVELGVGYRVIPNLTLGVYGSGAMFSRGDTVDNSANLYTSTAGIQSTWHFLPARELDPWVSLSSGWRGYWDHTNQGTTAMHGLQLARLQIGTDFRVAEAVAISPVISADLSMFLTQELPNQTAWHNIQTPNVNTFVFAGLQGRFDIPTGASPDRSVAAR